MKTAFIILLVLLILAAGLGFGILSLPQFGQLPKGTRLDRIKNSPNYKKGEFSNYSDTPIISSEKSQFSVMREFAFGEKNNVTPIDSIPTVLTDIKTLSPEENLLIWFGHSSYYLQVDGLKILVDPVFSGYASPFSFTNKAFLGTNLYQAEDFPAIDYLIISHDHYDHLDYETASEMKNQIGKVIVGLGVGQHFEYWGYDPSSIIELDWFEGIELGPEINLTATPARHYSGRGLKRNQTLWASYVLKTQTQSIYIGGDSGHDSFFNEIGEKFGPFDLAILEQGQYNQNWSLIHMLPEKILETAHQLKAKRIFPVHNSKFALAMHSWDEPLEVITEKKQEIPVITPKIGEVVYLNDSLQSFEKWWEN